MTLQPSSTDQGADAARPLWITDQLVVETQATWSPIYGRTLTVVEAIEILRTFGRLLDTLET